MNSLQVATPLQQRLRAALKSAALRELNMSALFSLGGVAAALLISLGAAAGAAEMLAGAHAGAVLAFSLLVWLALDSVLANLKRAHDGIRASIRDSYYRAAAALCVAARQMRHQAAAADNFFQLIFKRIFKRIFKLILTASASAAKSRTRARTPDAGRLLSSVRELFARTVAHLRATTSTLRAAGIRP